MPICECGCGQKIPWKPGHKYHPPRFIAGHHQHIGIPVKDRIYELTSNKTIRPNTPCACGCGEFVPDRYPDGRLRQIQNPDGLPYIRGHAPGYKLRGSDKHSSWKGGRFLSSDGYYLVYKPEHHLAQKDGYAYEHRIVWEEANGRELLPNEVVHHINSVRTDNRPENLLASTQSDHAIAHQFWQKTPEKASADAQAAGILGAAVRWKDHIKVEKPIITDEERAIRKRERDRKLSESLTRFWSERKKAPTQKPDPQETHRRRSDSAKQRWTKWREERVQHLEQAPLIGH